MKGPGYMISIILHLILPMFFYTIVTTALFLYGNLGTLEATALSALCTSPVLYWVYIRDQKIRGVAPAVSVRLHKCLVPILIFGAALCVLGNVIVEAFGLEDLSVAYEEASRLLYSPPVFVQILASGLIIPIAEELIFRGLIFASLRDKCSFLQSALLSALLFGLFHGNLPQGVYAFLIGMAVAWLYEVCGTLLAPYLFHVSANLLSLFVVNTSFMESLINWENKVVMVVMTAVSCGISVICALWIYWKNNLKEDMV